MPLVLLDLLSVHICELQQMFPPVGVQRSEPAASHKRFIGNAGSASVPPPFLPFFLSFSPLWLCCDWPGGGGTSCQGLASVSSIL